MNCISFTACLVVNLLTFALAYGDITRDFRRLLSDKTVQKAEVGIEVVRLGNHPAEDKVVFRHNSDLPLAPASNMKLITTACAIREFGSGFRFRTVLAQRGKELAIVGDGDPSFGDGELLAGSGWTITTVFDNWAQAVAESGQREFDAILVDDSILDRQWVHPNWPVDQLHKRYASQVGGLNLNRNCVNFYLSPRGPGELVDFRLEPPTSYVGVENACRRGPNAVWLSRKLGTNEIVLKGTTAGPNSDPISVTIDDPGMFAATVFREVLAGHGVRVGEVRRSGDVRNSIVRPGQPAAEGSWTVLAVHETPLSAVLSQANKDSDNLYAEALCKRLSATLDTPGSWSGSVDVIAEFLRGLGVSSEQFRIDDGSGLSRKNALSATAIGRVLSMMYHSSDRAAFLGSLSVAGADGTLRNRFRNSSLSGRVFGKSGYIQGVSCLSGYLQAKDGSWYAFSILINDISGGAKPWLDRAVEAIDRIDGG
jgi:D-alanyl-D-alanine carboxypeptidase/D-alanyl-D-alanine-endopeptidase (penicillin-binding protein 4)